MNGSRARPRVSTKNPPSGRALPPPAAAPERPAGAALRLKRKRHTHCRERTNNTSIASDNPFLLSFIAGEKEKKKTQIKSRNRVAAPGSVPPSVTCREPLPFPARGRGRTSHRAPAALIPGNPILQFNYRAAASPAHLYHLRCPGVPSLTCHRAIFNDDSY